MYDRAGFDLLKWETTAKFGVTTKSGDEPSAARESHGQAIRILLS